MTKMRNFTKRRIGGDVLPSEEQPGPKKPSIVRPFSQSSASSFQPWQPSWKKGLGGVISEASSSVGKPYLPHLANFNTSIAARDHNNYMNMENSNLDHAEKKNPNNIGGGTTSCAGGDDNPARTDEAPPRSGFNTQPEMDPKKLKRIMANRASAQRSRTRKNEYVADLEEKAKSCQNKISLLHPQIDAYKHRQRSLMIEQHKLKLQMAAREKERILQEVEIEKNKAEVKRLSELQRKQIAEARARMLNMGVAMQLMSNSNLNPSSLLNCLNSNQAQNGVGTSRLQTDISQQPQNQSQMWIDKWNNGQRSTPNLNIVKSEPVD